MISSDPPAFARPSVRIIARVPLESSCLSLVFVLLFYGAVTLVLHFPFATMTASAIEWGKGWFGGLRAPHMK